jgi:hypothetical protein
MARGGGLAHRLGFDLEHVGAEVAEDLAAEQTALGGEIEDTVGTEHRTFLLADKIRTRNPPLAHPYGFPAISYAWSMRHTAR